MGNLNDFGVVLSFPDLPTDVCAKRPLETNSFVVFLGPPGQVLFLRLDFDFGLLEAKPQISKLDLNSRSS